ncbi:tRNA methyltransferase [Helicobacter vulpis]|uniref:tRNA methyltransferase n=1 Tax=Helicobacter vulpis TaxID=2316076 RepID=UPI0013CE328C|nr:tRNA methyltransferase [Helicobacter vulpis]
MIRLLLLALLVLNLQAKERVVTIFIPISTLQEFQFFKAFKVLYDYMQKSFIEIDDSLRDPDDPNGRIPLPALNQATGDYTDASIPLAKSVAKQIPLFKEFKPKNQREELFLAHVKDMAMLHSIDIMDTSPTEKLTPLAHIFLNANTWLYAPLFNAHKAGLDVIAYLGQLHRIFSKKQVGVGNIVGFNMARLDEKNLKNIVPHKSFRKRLVQDMYIADTPTNIFCGEYGFWVSLVLNTIFNGGIPPDSIADAYEFSDFIDKNAQRIDPEHLFDLYTARVIPLERNAPFYDRLRNDNPKILKDTLKDHPTMCLSPKYLSPQSKQTCQQLFQSQTYNAKDIQEQVQLVRLLSIDDTPYVYLDPKDKLQVFKSDNAICQALQKMKF